MLPEALADQFLELYFAWQLSDKPNASINKHEKLGTIKKKKKESQKNNKKETHNITIKEKDT